MQKLKSILNTVRLNRIRSKILILFFFIAIISSVISAYSIYQLESIGSNVNNMESELEDIQSGITKISTFGLNISDIHAKIGVLINKMHHSIHIYERGNKQGEIFFHNHKKNFTALIQKLDDEISNKYGSLQVDIAHIQSNFNQYVLTVENQNSRGIFEEIESLNNLKNQLNNKLVNISAADLGTISSLYQQIDEKEAYVSEIFQTLDSYEKKIDTQLDSLIENLYFEIDTINRDAHLSNQVASQTRDSIESEITLYKMQLIGASLFFIIFAGVTGFYYSTKITNALHKLTDAANKIQKGVFPHEPISVNSHDEFQLLTDTFNSMVSSIKRLLKQKNEFINQLGHDLKNPLGPLVNLLPIIDKHTTNPKDKEILQVIQRNVDYMRNLVQKTLELARLNSPNTKLSIEQFNLKDKVNDIIEQNKYLFKQKQITVIDNISNDFTISADKLRFEELLNNLLNNSVKYNIKNGSITIDAIEKNNEILVSVTDLGIGMTKKQLNHIFDEFYKADESRHDFDSSGLGMAICKSIVEKHGGRIWAESEGSNSGSTFYFTIPVEPNLESLDHQTVSPSISEKVDELLMKHQ